MRTAFVRSSTSFSWVNPSCSSGSSTIRCLATVYRWRLTPSVRIRFATGSLVPPSGSSFMALMVAYAVGTAVDAGVFVSIKETIVAVLCWNDKRCKKVLENIFKAKTTAKTGILTQQCTQQLSLRNRNLWIMRLMRFVLCAVWLASVGISNGFDRAKHQRNKKHARFNFRFAMSLPRPTWRFHLLHIYIYIYNIIIYCDIVVFKYIYIYICTPIVCSNRGVEVIYVVKNAVPRTIQDTAYILQDTLLCRYPRQYMFISNYMYDVWWRGKPACRRHGSGVLFRGMKVCNVNVNWSNLDLIPCSTNRSSCFRKLCNRRCECSSVV